MLFQNICSDASRVQDCWNLAKTRVRTNALRTNLLVSYMPGAKNLKQYQNLVDRDLQILV